MQIYGDDILFGSTNESLCHELSSMISEEIEMSENLTFSRVYKLNNKKCTFIYQIKYTNDLIERFDMKRILVKLL